MTGLQNGQTKGRQRAAFRTFRAPMLSGCVGRTGQVITLFDLQKSTSTGGELPKETLHPGLELLVEE